MWSQRRASGNPQRGQNRLAASTAQPCGSVPDLAMTTRSREI
jgi:hypothetical protein